MQVVEANYGLAQDYFRLKARLLGLDGLMIYDQYAPVEQRTGQVPFAEGRDIVLDSYGDIDPRFREIAREFFDRRWIDAEPRPGKRGGAFCASPSPEPAPLRPVQLHRTPRDTMTLAHELGHGLHEMLARKQTLFNYHSTLPLAETASVFGEMLIFDRLVKREADPRARLGLLCQKIEDAFATVFRQIVLTRFEQGAFKAREEARLTPEQLGDIWIEANGRYYGDAVQMTDGYRWGWSYIPHFIHSRFYCYAYVFGELLVLALFRMYQEEGASFIPRFVTCWTRRQRHAGGPAGPVRRRPERRRLLAEGLRRAGPPGAPGGVPAGRAASAPERRCASRQRQVQRPEVLQDALGVARRRRALRQTVARVPGPFSKPSSSAQG